MLGFLGFMEDRSMNVFYSLISKIYKTPILCCPGPVQLHRSVKRALSQTQICHRDSSFEELQSRTAANICAIAKTDSKSHKIVFVTGSGTSANETVTLALGKLGRMLIISNGEFGERLQKLAALHHKQVDHLNFKWGQRIDLEKVSRQLSTKKYACLTVVHHETSTGMLNPIAKLAKLAHEHQAIIYVDVVSSLGAEVFEASKWKIDAFVSSSGKALASIPGIGIVGISNELSERIAKLTKTVQYLDLPTYILYADKFKQTPNTPAVHALAALQASTEHILKISLDEYQAVIKQRAVRVRTALRQLGLTYFDHGKLATSNVITCVERNDNTNIQDLLSFMRLRGIVLYGGKGELENMIFQIGHIGELSRFTMGYVLRMLKAYVLLQRQSKISINIKSTPLGQGPYNAISHQ
jgi:2-aminoethylphosphonate-pyruvate transaminase